MAKLGVKIPKGAFKKAQQDYAEGGDFAEDVELEPGRYVCILEKMDAVDTNNGPMLVARLTVAGEADEAGGRISVWFSLEPDRMVWLLRTLAKIGYDVDDIDEEVLSDILEQIETDRPVVRVSAKRSGEYVNLRIDKLIEELSASEALAEAGLGEEEGEEEDDEEEGEEEEDEYDGMNRTQLKRAIKEAGIDMRITSKVTDDDLRDALRANESEEDEGEEEEDEGEEEEIDLTSMDRKDLQQLSKERKLGIRFTKGKSDDDVRSLIAEKLGIELEEDEEEEDPEEGEEEEEGELSVGDTCVCTIRGKEVEDCEVISIDADAGKVKVRRGDNKKLATVSAENIAVD
jgi:hypothetical protein